VDGDYDSRPARTFTRRMGHRGTGNGGLTRRFTVSRRKRNASRRIFGSRAGGVKLGNFTKLHGLVGLSQRREEKKGGWGRSFSNSIQGQRELGCRFSSQGSRKNRPSRFDRTQKGKKRGVSQQNVLDGGGGAGIKENSHGEEKGEKTGTHRNPPRKNRP